MSRTDRPRRIAFFGLGHMGLPMATRLLAAGHRVTGHDPDKAATGRFKRAGGNVSTDNRQTLASSDCVILMLPNSDVVEAVTSQPGFDPPPDTVVVDMGSSEPLRTRALAANFAARGVTLLDAPVSGGVNGAIRGDLKIMAAGDSAALDRVVPLLNHLGTVTHVGESGAGHALKALNNLLSATHLLATAEAVHAGRRLGLQDEVMIEVFNASSGRSGSTENKWPRFISPGTFDSGFALRLMRKDLSIAVGLLDPQDRQNSLAQCVERRWAAAEQELAENADHTEIARWVADPKPLQEPRKP